MCVTALDSTELIISDRPQYFFDNGLIEEIQNIIRTVHAPKQLDENPVLQLDRPWEHFTNFGADDWAIWRDDDGGFQCLYTDMALDRDKLAREGGTLIDWHISRFRVMYARSTDGLKWEKPAMGIVHEGRARHQHRLRQRDLRQRLGPRAAGRPAGAGPDPTLQDAVRTLARSGLPGGRRNAGRAHPAGPFAGRDPLDPS